MGRAAGAAAPFIIGTDTGGTFTDTVVVDADGRSFVGKALTTHGHLRDGVLASIDRAEVSNRRALRSEPPTAAAAVAPSRSSPAASRRASSVTRQSSPAPDPSPTSGLVALAPAVLDVETTGAAASAPSGCVVAPLVIVIVVGAVAGVSGGTASSAEVAATPTASVSPSRNSGAT